MVDNRNKRKKHHDKDKYYRLAKEQGLRSRAAFKLVQINQKFPLLQTCQAGVLDLCAAPGGWTQIAARTCPPHIPIVAVDILPIRAMAGQPNVTTIVGDITTDKCKADIQKAVREANLQQNVDVVLHDGAPNVGAEYGKDAYEQNELTIHALRCATQHLKAGGHFITKVYRSRDYASLQWVLQQLFARVQALKPAASRSQSAEIFLICQHYKAPAKLDPRLLDPKHIFEEVTGDSTGGVMGGSTAAAAAGGLSIFHKNWDKPRRKRGGYNLEHLDATMRHIESVQHFVAVSSWQAAIQILSSSTGLAFQCEACRDSSGGGVNEGDDNYDDNKHEKCLCAFYKNHPLTTPEIKECVSDLQLLNKSDFKGLLTWRTKMQDATLAKRDMERDDTNDNDDVSAQSDVSDKDELDSDQEEQNIQHEITEMRQRRQREKKRQKKKERVAAAKRRRRAALGMDLNAIDIPEHDKVFSLATITSKGDLEAAAEVNLDRVSDEQLFGKDASDEDVVVGEAEDEDEDLDDEQRKQRRERDLEEAYSMYLEGTKNAAAKAGTKMAKRSKKLMRKRIIEEAEEDQEMAMVGSESLDYNTRTYADMLQGPRDSDDEDRDSCSDEEEDDGYDAEPMTPEEHAQKQRAKRVKQSDDQDRSNPLIHTFADEPASVKTARWFSNPVFSLMGKVAENKETVEKQDESEFSDREEVGSESDESSGYGSHRPEKDPKKSVGGSGLTAAEVLAAMPKTDKQIRHEKRLKALEREERKKTRRAKRLGETEGDFDLAPGMKESGDEVAADDIAHLGESVKKRVIEARQLIKAGMGLIVDENNKDSAVEIVAAEETRPLPVMDDRKYDSDHVDYDSDDYAQTLALGTMMLRRSKEKALVDASYNRYAWNDPEDLPEWFVDDEAKHYRPQLPIPPALVAKMKERMMALSTKPIKKVAEARARKSKRAKAKLAAAKKQAEAVANSAEMSEAMKLKAISKALRGQETKKPGKSYVVAKKGRAGQHGGKGVKLVDKRMKADKRGLDRAEKKRKAGSKRRRKYK